MSGFQFEAIRFRLTSFLLLSTSRSSKVVMLSRFTAAIFACMLAVVVADVPGLTIVSPGGPNLWWVAQSENNIVWTCQTSPVLNFTIFIANPNPSILVSPMAIVAIEPNADCSKSITQDQSNQAAGTGYTIQFTDILNSSNIYAQSEPFEIKALGATYPASSATPTDTGTATGSATGSTSSSSSTSKPKSAASGLSASIGFSVAAAAAVLGFLTA